MMTMTKTTTKAISRRQALATGAAVAAGALPGRARAQAPAAAPLPAELFFENPSFIQATLSPSGAHAAVVVGSAEHRHALVIIDLATRKLTPVARLTDLDIGWVQWVSDERVVFRGVDFRNSLERSQGATRMLAVDIDGSRYRTLDHRWGMRPAPAPGAQQDGWLHVSYWEAQDFGNLMRVDTRSDRFQNISHPPRANDWLVDGRGELRAVLTLREDRAALHARDDAGGWKLLREADRFTGGMPWPYAVLPDGQWLVGSSEGRDTRALFRFDPVANRLADKPLLAVDGFDLDPHALVWRDERLAGLRFLADAEVTVWLDAEMKALQAEIDERLGATVNVLQPPRRGPAPHVLVTAYSDVHPPRFFAWHRGERTLTLLGASRPRVQPAQMAQMDFLRYAARDGLSIPAYLTLPKVGPGGGAPKKLPLVVLVHGGPWLRGATWGWDGAVQFLASRGYAVLQPEFRGSTGFGSRHFRSSFKQWGLAMQDDLTDGARWAIAQGVADPQRVAIVGASYGGYASLMGLVKEPELFRCGVCWAGVSDIDLMYAAHWSDAPGVWKDHGMPQLIGDREKDAEQLRATSPLQQAARIRNPLLIAHGRLDERVPVQHGRRLYEAVKAHNPAVEYVEYAEEGHGWHDPATQVAWWQRVEAFLGRHLA
jgi:dipeptidyl aminopeptidase/acylaminoacyl peptidase